MKKKKKELKRRSSADTPYNKKEALDQLTYALTPYSSTIKNNLRGKSIKKDFESFKEFIDKDDPNYISSFALGTDRYGNLDILPSGINEEKIEPANKALYLLLIMTGVLIIMFVPIFNSYKIDPETKNYIWTLNNSLFLFLFFIHFILLLSILYLYFRD